MPIYEYQCQGCEHEFETIQKMSDAPLIQCPSCGKDLLRKKISAVAFRLKGGGWYETDFKSGDKKNVASSSDSPAESSSSEGSKKEKKSDAKSGASEGKSSSTGGSSDAASKSSSASASKSASDGDKKGSKNGSPKSETKSSSGGDKPKKK
jgi:putative FmdB family regulatory protein